MRKIGGKGLLKSEMKMKNKKGLAQIRTGVAGTFCMMKSKSGVITTTLQNPGFCQALTRGCELIVIYNLHIFYA